MSAKTVDVLVVGAGQAGIAMSEHLSSREIEHVVLERHRVVERWRSERWDSLVANGPAWHDRFPGMQFEEVGPDDFASRNIVVDYFERYAELIKAPIRTGVEVTSVRRHTGRSGFAVETSDGSYDAQFVVSATGAFQVPVIPSVVPRDTEVLQLHSSSYRNPDQLPQGAALVIGSGSSGVQIAEELNLSGRATYLSVGPHERPPRRYRGRDFVWWLGVLGIWDAQTPPGGAEHTTIAVSGAHGGRTVDLRDLASQGVTLVGMTQNCDNGVLEFSPDLVDLISSGDDSYLSLLRQADDYAVRNGLDLPPEPEAHILGPMPECAVHPLRQLDLVAAGVTSIVWATGFTADYSWLQVDAFDETGRPQHSRGVSTESGVYFLGLPWLSRRGSSFIWGVWHDAQFLANHIATQRGYHAYPGQ